MEMETCRPVHPAQVVPLRAVKCMPHLHRAVARKRQHSSQQQKRVAECKRQHAYLSPCASATLYLEEHHLQAQSRLRRPLGRTTANGRAELYPAFGVWSPRSFQSASILPIRMGVRSTLRAIRFRLSPGYMVARLHDRVLLGGRQLLPASVRTWPCDAPAPIDSQGTDKEVTTTRSRRSSASDGFRFSHIWHHLENRNGIAVSSGLQSTKSTSGQN